MRTLKVAFLNYSTSNPRDFVFLNILKGAFSRRTWGEVDEGAEFFINAFHTRPIMSHSLGTQYTVRQF